MQISSRFTMAVHMLICMEIFKDQYKITGDFLASSIDANPVIIRRILSQLKDAGLIFVRRGAGGAAFARPPEKITLLDIYDAVECVGEKQLFHFHEHPNPDCPVGKNIHKVLDNKLKRAQTAMERELQSVTLLALAQELRQYAD